MMLGSSKFLPFEKKQLAIFNRMYEKHIKIERRR